MGKGYVLICEGFEFERDYVVLAFSQNLLFLETKKCKFESHQNENRTYVILEISDDLFQKLDELS